MFSEIKITVNLTLRSCLRGVIKFTVVAAIGLLWLAVASSLLAAQCSPDSGCTGCSNKGAEIKCKFDRLANASDQMIGRMQQSPDLSEVHRNGLQKAKDRLQREKGRLKSDDFQVMSKKKGAGCQLVEAENSGGNGDGVCEPEKGELCAEVKGDGIGNDDGICSPMKGKKREVCAQICDEEAILQSESNMDTNTAAEIESTYDNMTDHVQELSDTIAAAPSALPTAGLQAASQNPCAFDPKPSRTSDSVYKAAKWATMGSRSAADVLERFCDQTFTSVFFTWTFGAACVVAETIAAGTNEWLDILDTKEAILDAEVVDSTLSCARQTMEAVDDGTARIQAVQDGVARLKAKQATIVQLIKTPPGKRPDYPKPK
jgi:hypothetical protein